MFDDVVAATGGAASGGQSSGGASSIGGSGGFVSSGGTVGLGGSVGSGGFAGFPAGGTAGTGGFVTGGTAGTLSMIDDFEDRNSSILPVEGRSGNWHAFYDATPGALITWSIRNAGRVGSLSALNFNGGVFTDWGAGVDVPIAGGGAYDASRFSGIAFWARTSAASSREVRLSVVDAHTTPEGGSCEVCFDHFGRWMVLSDSWQRYEFRWDQLTQMGWGDLFSEVQASAIYAIQFSTRADARFDVWIDDLAFFH
jgi:hypothetical protein